MKIDKLIVHCSATREGQHITIDTIKDWHVKGRGWRDVGYHYVIYLDGTIKKGREDNVPGAHCKQYNRILFLQTARIASIPGTTTCTI